MLLLDSLDATRLCSRWSDVGSDQAAWARPIPTVVRPKATPVPHSWRSLAANPRALLLTGMVVTAAVPDAIVRLLSHR